MRGSKDTSPPPPSKNVRVIFFDMGISRENYIHVCRLKRKCILQLGITTKERIIYIIQIVI